MHPWTIPILGVVALSLAVPSGAEARLRFGPGVVLGAVAGVMFGGFRHSFRHHRRHAVRLPSRPQRYFGPMPPLILPTTCCLRMAKSDFGPTAMTASLAPRLPFRTTESREACTVSPR